MSFSENMNSEKYKQLSKEKERGGTKLRRQEPITTEDEDYSGPD